MIRYFKVALVFLSVSIYSCHDAPKSNPFDPVSGDIRTLEGDYTIRSQDDFDGLIAEGGRAFEITGTLDIQPSRVTSLEGLRKLTRVGGDLVIGNGLFPSDSLTSLRGLQSLSEVGGSLRIEGHRKLTSLDGLESLQRVGGELIIEGNLSLTTLDGMNNLLEVRKEISLFNNHPLNSVEALNNLRRGPCQVE